MYEKAKKYLVGGVNAPIRAFPLIDIKPLYIKKSIGPYITTTEDRNFISFISGWGSIILGDCYPELIEEIKEKLNDGIYSGLSNEYEYLLAELIIEHGYPYHQMLRFVNSGTEANTIALRLARAITGRNKIVKFDGGYHGSIDYLLVENRSSEFGNQIPSSSGVPKRLIKDTVSLPYNDIDVLEEFFSTYGKEIAAVIVEPIQTSNLLIKATPTFLSKLRELTKINGCFLIFDEVSTCFRESFVGLGRDIKPDITVIGKIIGGGFPIGAVLSSKEYMEVMAPIGNMSHSGVFAGHPISTFAGYKVLSIIKSIPNFYESIKSKIDFIVNNIKDDYIKINYTNGMFCVYFSDKKIESSEDLDRMDIMFFIDFYKVLISEGIVLSPHPLEPNYITYSHGGNVLEIFIEKVNKALSVVRG
ncbi:MAG: aspartate aminotransferase family protein [Candidatus Calescibacterium sp.]|nr:aspartate aminotransferase family protein [Candidatus Calescibacterium sp.]MCX7972606.1 aspartate aminotransferase family protein [bacterium]MDW8195759.1 aspartate aminotransferase family protein [Candidatus Calescibacterium sp.]